MKREITVAMATFPPRKAGMLKVVAQLLPQCDRLCLYLNGYTEVPEELQGLAKLELILAGPGCEAPDKGSQGKLHWLHKYGDSYYLTVDDDIIYPKDYVKYMVDKLDYYEGKAIVGLHGCLICASRVPGRPARITRKLLPYDKAYGKDIVVHGVGMGVAACVPCEVGLTCAVVTGALHSGDDEDIAVWAQQRRVPIIKLATRMAWVKPDAKTWIIDPLHRRPNYLKSAEQKLLQVQRWLTFPPPKSLVQLAPLTVVPKRPVRPLTQPIKVHPRMLSNYNAVQKKQAHPPPPTPTVRASPKPTGPSFDDVLLTTEQRAFTVKIMSSDALAAQVVDRIKQRTATSVIRMSDGERAMIAYSKTGKMEGFMKDPAWLKRYGLEGADLAQVGRDLLWAGEKADYLACTISGLFWDIFKVDHYFPERARFIDQFYPQLWACTDRVGAVLRAGPVLVLHRQHAKLVPVLSRKYALQGAEGMMLDSWKDQEGLIDAVGAHAASTVLVSGGASGKPFCVKLAQATGKVVLDVGEALTGVWVNDKEGWHDAAGRAMNG